MAPRVFAYLDYRAFLRDWLDHTRREHPGYSYAAFAAAGGCSRSALANVLSGARRPRAATLDAFARAMDLSPSERNYLGLLADLDAALDAATRHRVMEKILASERYRQVRVAEHEPPGNVGRYLASVHAPAIRELARLPGFREDAAWIAGTLRPAISEEQAQRALDLLFELDLLAHRADGSVEVQQLRFRSEPETADEAVIHFQREVMPELIAAADPDNGAQQHLVSATISLSADMLPEAKAILTTALSKLATLSDERPTDTPRAVYQAGAQLLPLSERV